MPLSSETKFGLVSQHQPGQNRSDKTQREMTRKDRQRQKDCLYVQVNLMEFESGTNDEQRFAETKASLKNP